MGTSGRAQELLGWESWEEAFAWADETGALKSCEMIRARRRRRASRATFREHGRVELPMRLSRQEQRFLARSGGLCISPPLPAAWAERIGRLGLSKGRPE